MPSNSYSGLQSFSVAASLPTARIVRRQDCTDDLFLLWLEPSIKLHFTPGQCVTLGAGGIERPYSIASAPYEPTIELFVGATRRDRGWALRGIESPPGLATLLN